MPNQVLPEISIIVPVYNPPEKYLRECLDSLIGQSLKNIEIILIDNASIGGCPQILQEYAARDNRIKLFRFEENQGFSGACNQGIELSVAPYFQIVDSDDILAKSACQKENNVIKKLKPDVLIFNHVNFDCITNKIDKSPIYPQLQKKKTFCLSNKSSDIFLIPFCAWNKIYSKQFIKKHHLQFLNKLKTAAPDCLFSAQVFTLAQKISYIPDYLYTYRRNILSSIMSQIKAQNSQLYHQVFDFCRELEKFSLTNSTPEKNKFLNKLYMEILIFNYSQIHKSNKPAYYVQMQKLLQTNNPKFFVPQNLKDFDLFEQYREIINTPYWLYSLKQRIYKHTRHKIKLGFLTLYKQKKLSSVVSHIFLSGIFKIKIDANEKTFYFCGLKIWKKKGLKNAAATNN